VQETPLRSLLRLAVPLVLADVGWISMGIVDTMMVGRIGIGAATAIAAVSVSSMFFSTIAAMGSGLMLGLDPLVAHAHGGGRLDECRQWLRSGLHLVVAVSPPLMATLWLCVPLFRLFGYEPALLAEITRFLHALVWSMPPLILYMAFRRYLQATNRTRPVTFALITANLVNAGGNWILIYGHLGAPALGTVGSALSTVAARTYMAAVLVAFAWYEERWRLSSLRERLLTPDWARLRKLIALGLPAAGQIAFEIGVFAMAGALMGKLGSVTLAAHQVTLQTISTTFMVTIGIGSAAAVRVGQSLGRGEPPAAERFGWTAIAMSIVFMTSCSVLMLVFPRAIGRGFTADGAVIGAAVPLLAIGALFQIFDGVQSTAMGALRGIGDTRTPMLCHMIAYWTIGLPAGYALCFSAGWGPRGMWTGLSIAVILVASVLVWIWARKSARLGGAKTAASRRSPSAGLDSPG
jgi:MATE family multidrug resistance protein